MQRILFLDIDGVFIPGRVYMMAGQTKPIVTTFCPSVVGMVNDICKQTGAKLVIHSSWLRSSLQFLSASFEGDTPSTHEWMIRQGLKAEYFHEDHSAKWKYSGTRWNAITDWLLDHPDVEYWVLDDEPLEYSNDVLYMSRTIHTDFNEGLTYAEYSRILEEWSAPSSYLDSPY